MISLKLDENNNIQFNDGFILTDETESIIQDIRNRLLMFKTEYPFNTNLGINYYDLAILNNKNAIINAVKKRILEDSRILAISSIDLSFENQKINLKLELETTQGTINV